jgi:hypothetical protein
MRNRGDRWPSDRASFCPLGYRENLRSLAGDTLTVIREGDAA